MSKAQTEILELSYSARPLRYGVLALIGLGGVAFGIYMIVVGFGTAWSMVFMGVLFTIVFAVMVFVAATILTRGGGGLRLERNGFTIRSPFRSAFFRWRDIVRFRVMRTTDLRHSVVFDFHSSYQGQRMLRGPGRRLGYEGIIPDNYGRTADELAELLNEWRERGS
ncbi:MAG TPA: hypothetical protein VMA09_04225 [Candidatus Binataceae bacterium]|nr:hypothetical protein [Candidatus Binataceae bacterium]